MLLLEKPSVWALTLQLCRHQSNDTCCEQGYSPVAEEAAYDYHDPRHRAGLASALLPISNAQRCNLLCVTGLQQQRL